MAPKKGDAPRDASSKRKRPVDCLRSAADQGGATGGGGEPPLRSSKRPKTSPVGAPLSPAGEDGDVPLADVDISTPGVDSGMDVDSSAAADTSLSSADSAMDHDSPADVDTSFSSIDLTMDVDFPAGGTTNKPGKHPKRVIDSSLPPISDVHEMFEDMVKRVNPSALAKTPIKLFVATICSGTDAPILALSLIQDAMQAMGHGAGFEFDHLFSCEIEPAKQGFIRRNLPHPTVIYRDVMELANIKDTGEA